MHLQGVKRTSLNRLSQRNLHVQSFVCVPTHFEHVRREWFRVMKGIIERKEIKSSPVEFLRMERRRA